MKIPSRKARFRDYDSAEARGTLCLLADNYGDGAHLGQVFAAGGSWVWEAADCDWEIEDAADRGEEDTRREAKAALRAYLKDAGVLI